MLKHLSFLLLLALLGCGKAPETAPVPERVTCDASRLVVFTPSLTEIVWELGLGKNVVGVSKFCAYPPEAAVLPKIGGFLDPDLETILRLAPSCAILQKNSTELAASLRKLGIPVLEVPGDSLQEVLDSFTLLGKALDRQEQGEALRQRVSAALERPRHDHAPRVLVVIWRDAGCGTIKDVQIAANDGYFKALLQRLGAAIVPEDTTLAYPTISAEAILRSNPDCIVELQPGLSPQQAQGALDDWKHGLPQLEAVQKQRVCIITDDYATIPGPRLAQFAQKLSELLQ